MNLLTSTPMICCECCHISEVRQRQQPWRVAIFGVISLLLGLGGALPAPCCGCRGCCLSSLALGSPQLKGSFGNGSGPRGSVCDSWRHGLETCPQQTEIPVLSQAEGSPGCPHKQVPFHANACPESSVPPTREKPVLFQCPTDGTSHQKAFHSFHHIMYCFVPFVVEEMVLPNIFHFQSQQAAINASCHCWGLCMLYVWRHQPWLNVAISSNYVTVLHRRLYFNYSPNSAMDKHLGSAALQSQQVQTFRRPPYITQHHP